MTSGPLCAGKEIISVEDPWLTPDGSSAPSSVSPPGKLYSFTRLFTGNQVLLNP